MMWRAFFNIGYQRYRDLQRQPRSLFTPWAILMRTLALVVVAFLIAVSQRP